MRGWLQNLGLFVILLVCLWLIAALGGPAVPIASLVLGMLLAVFVHELGHVIAGTLTGMRVTGVAVGPYELDFASKRVYPHWNRRLNVRGVWIFEPRAADLEQAAYAWRMTVLGGPAANFVLSSVLGMLNLTLFAGQPHAQMELAFIACVSAVIGGLSLRAGTAGLSATDGAILWRMWTDLHATENDMRAQQLAKSLASGTRPRDWDNLALADALLSAPRALVDATAKVTAVVYKYRFVADGGDLRGALPVLESAVRPRALWSQRAATDPIDLVIVLLARHYALWGNDAAKARVLLDMLHPHSWVRSCPEWQMTTALVKLSQGDRAAAMKHIALARKQLAPQAGRIGVVKMEVGWLDRAEQRIAKQLTAPAVAPGALKASNPEVKQEALALHRPPHLTSREPSIGRQASGVRRQASGIRHQVSGIGRQASIPAQQSTPTPSLPAQDSAPAPSYRAQRSGVEESRSPSRIPDLPPTGRKEPILKPKSSPEPRLSRAARNAWQEVAVAVNQSLLQCSRQVALEYGEARSWLYRAPGIPPETKVAFARIPLSSAKSSPAAFR